MKTFIKIISFALITFILNSIFITNVKADACDGISGCRVSPNRGAVLVSGEGQVGTIRPLLSSTEQSKLKTLNYTYASIGVTGFGSYNVFNVHRDGLSALYCLDPQHQGYNPIYASRFLLNENAYLQVQAHDYAIMSILTGSGTKIIASDPKGEDLKDFWSRLLAIRSIILTFNYEKGTGDSVEFSKDFRAGHTVVNEWLKDPEVVQAYDALNQALIDSKVSGLNSKGAYGGYPDYNFVGSPVYTAKLYYIQALKEATEFLNNVRAESKIDHSAVAGEIKENSKEEQETKGIYLSKEVEHTFKVSNIPKASGSSFKIMGMTYDKTKYTGLETSISYLQIGDKVYSTKEQVQGIIGKNLVDLGFDLTKETIIKMKVTLSGWKTSKDNRVQTLKCGQSSIKYDLLFEFNTNRYGKYSNYLATVWMSQNPVMYKGKLSAVQRYVGVESIGGGTDAGKKTTSKVNYETSLIEDCNCTDLRKSCIDSGNINSADCKTFLDAECGACEELQARCDLKVNTPDGKDACEQFTAVCDVKCETTYSGFECCEEETDLLIVSEEDNKEVYINGPDNLKACFVTQIDNYCESNGNNACKNTSAKDEKKNKYALASMNNNKYCTVSCKEDYAMKMPTAKLVNAGRYFTFRVKVDGTKTCYTNTINREQFNKDMVKKEEELVKAYNDYLEWYTLYYYGSISTTTNRYPSGVSCGSRCNNSITYTDYEDYWVVNATTDDYLIVKDRLVDIGNITVEKNTNSYKYTLAYEAPTGTGRTTCPGDSWTVSCNCTTDSEGHRSCSTCHRSCSSKSYTYYTGTRVVNTQAQLKQSIKAKIDNYANKLKIKQDEYNKIIKDYNSCSTWTTDINYKPLVSYDYEENYLEAFRLPMGEMEDTITSPSNTNWYCNSSFSIDNRETRVAKITGNDYKTCSNGGSSSVRYNNINFMYCTTSGCAPKTQRVSDARYKKVTSKITANYKPATLFYNIYPSGEITDKTESNTNAITNGLPVSLATKRGIYKYTVNIENLGEFYENNTKNNLGRYVGGKNKATVEPEILKYNCAYLVNIPTKDGWVCDFDDNDKCTDDCISNCIGAGCGTEDPGYCDGNECIAECVGVGCIYDTDAGTSVNERIVSLNNLFPNGTKSYNWNKNSNSKAKLTIEEIEEKGNKVYDEKPILSLTISPSTASSIKEYNREYDDSGGYSNNTLKCFKLGSFNRGACYSSFIDDLLNEQYGKNVVSDKSKIADENYRTGTDVSENHANSNNSYFRIWTWNLSNKEMIGPAWK